ncbi:MAG TPA: hypothetical protein VK760_06275 [Candidatus Acidoferrales bacterium]|jgi:hypothetical protein|nr:hypothetical protein [Candidatus Acidoferrales bacterium]
MLSTLMLLAATAGTPTIPSGTYTYSAAVAGKAVGTSTLTVKAGPPIEIDEQAIGGSGAQASSAKATLMLGPDLAPISYTGNYNTAGAPNSVSATLTPTTATVGQQTYPLTGNAKHFVVAELGLTAGLFVLPAQMQAWNNATALVVAPAMVGMAGTIAIAPDNSLAGARPAAVPAQDLALAIGGQFPFTIWYDPATYVPDEIDVPSQNVVVSRVRQ